MPISEADFAHVEDDRFRELIRYWLDVRADGVVPTVEAIDPARFRHLLEQVWLCVVEERPREFRYRLAGDHIRAAYTGPLVGRTLRDLTDPSVFDRVSGYFDRVVDEPAVVHVVGRIYTEESSPARGERLILPFFDRQAGRVARILGATVHSWESRGVGRGVVPVRQVRTITPADGRPAWCESWL